jgi:hypothetical protein
VARYKKYTAYAMARKILIKRHKEEFLAFKKKHMQEATIPRYSDDQKAYIRAYNIVLRKAGRDVIDKYYSEYLTLVFKYKSEDFPVSSCGHKPQLKVKTRIVIEVVHFKEDTLDVNKLIFIDPKLITKGSTLTKTAETVRYYERKKK